MELANNLTRRNPELDQTELNFAVQRIMDLIIFLRIAEDRGTEAAGQLQELASGSNVYAKLRTLFERADERYNSGLFYFAPEKGRSEQPDSLTPRLTVDDKTLKDIVLGLY